MRCVRPDFTTSSNSAALAANAASRCSSAGSSRFVASSSAARWTALGNTSLDDWPMFTWSLGCTPSPARLAMTSLAFMFVEVPDPVWKTSIGNWSSCRPAPMSSAAAPIRSARSASSLPRSALTRAAAPLIAASQRTTLTGTRSPETGKFSTALAVSPPHRCCSATLISSPFASSVTEVPTLAGQGCLRRFARRRRRSPGDVAFSRRRRRPARRSGRRRPGPTAWPCCARRTGPSGSGRGRARCRAPRAGSTRRRRTG